MNENLYEITFANGRSIILLAEESCVNKSLKDKDKFRLQLKVVLKSFGNILLQNLDNTLTYGEYVLHLYRSNMLDTGQEFAFKSTKAISFENRKRVELFI